MIPKKKEKRKAIRLRRKGLSYREILEKVPVAKSTLSLWLRSVGLTKRQKQRLTEKKRKAALKGARKRREQRIKRTKKIKRKARKEIEKISKEKLKLIGAALYWAEGKKQKKYRTGASLSFSNSDSRMILLYTKWLKEVCSIPKSRLVYSLYIHESGNWQRAKRYWANILSVQKNKINVYFKHNKIKSRRKKKKYYGLINIRVRRSTQLNRKVAGWIEGICKQCGVV